MGSKKVEDRRSPAAGISGSVDTPGIKALADRVMVAYGDGTGVGVGRSVATVAARWERTDTRGWQARVLTAAPALPDAVAAAGPATASPIAAAGRAMGGLEPVVAGQAVEAVVSAVIARTGIGASDAPMSAALAMHMATATLATRAWVATHPDSHLSAAHAAERLATFTVEGERLRGSAIGALVASGGATQAAHRLSAAFAKHVKATVVTGGIGEIRAASGHLSATHLALLQMSTIDSRGFASVSAATGHLSHLPSAHLSALVLEPIDPTGEMSDIFALLVSSRPESERLAAAERMADRYKNPVHPRRWPPVERALRTMTDESATLFRKFLLGRLFEAVDVALPHTGGELHLIRRKLRARLNSLLTKDILGPGWRQRVKSISIDRRSVRKRLVAPDHDGDRDARLALDHLIARAGLSPKQAAVVAELRRGYDFAQIAAHLGIEPVTARVHWYRARQKLLAAL